MRDLIAAALPSVSTALPYVTAFSIAIMSAYAIREVVNRRLIRFTDAVENNRSSQTRPQAQQAQDEEDGSSGPAPAPRGEGEGSGRGARDDADGDVANATTISAGPEPPTRTRTRDSHNRSNSVCVSNPGVEVTHSCRATSLCLEVVGQCPALQE